MPESPDDPRTVIIPPPICTPEEDEVVVTIYVPEKVKIEIKRV